MTDTMIGVDLAKRILHLHFATMKGKVRDYKNLTPDQFRGYMPDVAECVVAFEACCSAN